MPVNSSVNSDDLFNGILPSSPTGGNPYGYYYYYSSNSPKLKITINETQVNAGGSFSAGIFYKNSSKSFTVTISNSGATNSTLFIPTGGISLSGDGSLANNPVANTGKSLINPSSNSITFTAILNTSTIGFNEIRISIVSNDPLENPFRFKIGFSVIEAPVLPVISLRYKDSEISNNSSIAIGNFPLNGLNSVTLNISNSGSPTLTIGQNAISLTSANNAVVFSSNPVSSSGINIPFNTSASFSILLDTSSLGSKTVIIVVVSNDTNHSPYIVTLSYTILRSFNLVVEEDSTPFTNDELVNLGNLYKKTSIVKRISLINDGIFHNIRVLGIIAEGSIVLKNIPALPFILQANKLNVAQFQANFDSSSLGKKTGDIKIQWEVAS